MIQTALDFSRTPRRRRSYHVSRPIPGDAHEAASEIKEGERRALGQEEAILAFFMANPGRWTPSQVRERVSPRKVPAWVPSVYYRDGIPDRLAFSADSAGELLWPITSVRRSMTNLSDDRRYDPPPLRCTLERVDGPHGRPEHLWELAG